MTDEYPKTPDKPTLYHYKLQVTLGRGGTGTVYRGLDPNTGQIFALKQFRADFIRNNLHLRQITKATGKFIKLAHPNVVRIYEFIQGDEGKVLVLEFIDGPNLGWYLKNRPYDTNELLVVLAQICNGLGYLHDNNLVHHDIKPANILFTRRGQVKLCDFSLSGAGALLSLFNQAGVEQVTPMYVAPEILRKKKATPLSDLYSLGVMMYLMFVGKHPFEVDNLQKLYECQLNQMPFPPSTTEPRVPEPISNIIMKLLAKNPKDRFGDCDELRIALSQVATTRI